MRKYKVIPRKKAAAWKRRRRLATAWWTILAVGLGYSARLGADRLGQAVFLPVRSLEMGRLPQIDSNVAVWEKILLLEIEEAWRRRSRVRCAWEARDLSRDLMAKHHFVKELRLNWMDFLMKGQARLVATFRVPLASAGGFCVDGEGVKFFCPKEMKTRRLVELELADDEGLRSRTYAAIAVLEEALAPARRIVRIGSLGEQVFVYEDQAGQSYRLSLDDVQDGQRLRRSSRRLAAVLSDLASRQEKFRYIDLTLSHKGRIFVGA